MSEVTQAELNILQTIRELRPYEKIEIKLKDNIQGEVIVTITSNRRIEYAI